MFKQLGADFSKFFGSGSIQSFMRKHSPAPKRPDQAMASAPNCDTQVLVFLGLARFLQVGSAQVGMGWHCGMGTHPKVSIVACLSDRIDQKFLDKHPNGND
jgi:hypothetical protein